MRNYQSSGHHETLSLPPTGSTRPTEAPSPIPTQSPGEHKTLSSRPTQPTLPNKPPPPVPTSSSGHHNTSSLSSFCRGCHRTSFPSSFADSNMSLSLFLHRSQNMFSVPTLSLYIFKPTEL